MTKVETVWDICERCLNSGNLDPEVVLAMIKRGRHLEQIIRTLFHGVQRKEVEATKLKAELQLLRSKL